MKKPNYKVKLDGKTINFAHKINNPIKDQILFVIAKTCKEQRRLVKGKEIHSKFITKTVVREETSGKGDKKKTKQVTSYVEQKITRDVIKHHCGSLSVAIDQAREMFPELFETVVEDKVFIPNQMQKLDQIINDDEIKRYIITTAVGNATPHKGFIKAMQNYSERNSAEILVTRADSNYESLADFFYDNDDLHVIFQETALNNNVFISDIKVKASQFNPVVGLDRICKKNQSSAVIASPKQSMKVVANQKGKDPHVLVSTGACTNPNYQGKKYGQQSRRDYMAKNDHILGALIVEIKNDEIFFFRHVQAEKSGAFIDLGVKYYPKKHPNKKGLVSIEKAEAISLGDWHSSEKQLDVCKIFVEDVAKVVGAREVLIHDFFDGESISHHTKNSVAQRSALSLEGRLSLADEFHEGVNDLNWLTDNFDKVTMVPSNHNEFVDRLLDDKRWLGDAENAFLASLLFPYAVYSNLLNNIKNYDKAIEAVAKHMKMNKKQLLKQVPDLATGKSPVQVGCEFYDLKNPEKVNWLKRDEEYRIAGVELGQHGDKGAHGSRGSANSLEKVLGKAIIGHSHTPCIHFGIYQNGTLSRLDPNYATGPSGWMHSSTVLYKNGSRQMIHVIGGEWKLNDAEIKRKAKKATKKKAKKTTSRRKSR